MSKPSSPPRWPDCSAKGGSLPKPDGIEMDDTEGHIDRTGDPTAGTTDQNAWDVAAQASALAGTDLRGSLALFKRAVDLSAGSGAADLELQRLWAEVAIEVGIPDAQTRPVIDSVIAATADDDPGAMAFALGTLARLEHRSGRSHQAQTLMDRSAALLSLIHISEPTRPY